MQHIKLADDFEWNTYTKNFYLNEAISQLNSGPVLTIVDKVSMDNDNLLFPQGLHENYKYLYQDIVSKKVRSVFEVGCGGSHNLNNIKYLLKNFSKNYNKIGGIEYSEDQVKTMSKFLNVPKEITNYIIIGDASDESLALPLNFEYVFTNAVINSFS